MLLVQPNNSMFMGSKQLMCEGGNGRSAWYRKYSEWCMAHSTWFLVPQSTPGILPLWLDLRFYQYYGTQGYIITLVCCSSFSWLLNSWIAHWLFPFDYLLASILDFPLDAQLDDTLFLARWAKDAVAVPHVPEWRGTHWGTVSVECVACSIQFLSVIPSAA